MTEKKIQSKIQKQSNVIYTTYNYKMAHNKIFT